MAKQTTYVLNVRVTPTGEAAPMYGIRVDWGVPQAALPIQPLTLVDLEKIVGRAAWHTLEAGLSEPSSEDIELERLRGMAHRGEIVLGPGGMPEGFWDMPMPEDPEGLVRRALIEDRDGS